MAKDKLTPADYYTAQSIYGLSTIAVAYFLWRCVAMAWSLQSLQHVLYGLVCLSLIGFFWKISAALSAKRHAQDALKELRAGTLYTGPDRKQKHVIFYRVKR